MSWAVALLVTDQVQYVAQVGFFWTSVTSMLAAISGVLLFGSDVQHGTLATAVAARPARWVLALSKTLTAAALGLVIGAAGLAAGFGGALIAGLPAGDTAALAASVGWALLFTTLSAVLGLGISMIVRNSTAAIGGLLVWGYLIENLFKLFLADEVARFLPFVAGNHLLAYTSKLEPPTHSPWRSPARERGRVRLLRRHRTAGGNRAALPVGQQLSPRSSDAPAAPRSGHSGRR